MGMGIPGSKCLDWNTAHACTLPTLSPHVHATDTPWQETQVSVHFWTCLDVAALSRQCCPALETSPCEPFPWSGIHGAAAQVAWVGMCTGVPLALHAELQVTSARGILFPCPGGSWHLPCPLPAQASLEGFSVLKQIFIKLFLSFQVCNLLIENLISVTSGTIRWSVSS